jgi:hypothetical protein
VALIRRVFLRLNTKMGDQHYFFCVKSGKNPSDICAMLPEACGGEPMKKLGVSEWHKVQREFALRNHV